MMKASELDQPEGNWTEVGEEKSGSTTNVYKISWSKDQGYRCECDGWRSSHSKPKICRHIKRFMFRSQLELKMGDWEVRGFVTFQKGAAELIRNKIMEMIKDVWGA